MAYTIVLCIDWRWVSPLLHIFSLSKFIWESFFDFLVNRMEFIRNWSKWYRLQTNSNFDDNGSNLAKVINLISIIRKWYEEIKYNFIHDMSLMCLIYTQVDTIFFHWIFILLPKKNYVDSFGFCLWSNFNIF